VNFMLVALDEHAEPLPLHLGSGPEADEVACEPCLRRP